MWQVGFSALIVLAGAALPGIARAKNQAPFRPQMEGAEAFVEQFTAMASLDDGTFIQLQLGVSNIGMGDGKGGCRILVFPASGKPWLEDEQYGEDRWQYTAEPLPMFSVPRCYARGGAAVEYYAAIGDGLVRITLAASHRSVRPPGGRLTKEERFYEKEIIVPWAHARVELQMPGGQKRVHHGWGYADHSRSTTMPSDIARQWVRFRSFNDGNTILLVARFPPDEGAVVGWVWRQPQEAPTAILSLALTPLRGTKAPSWQIDVRTEKRVLLVRSGRLLYRHAPVEEMGLIGHLVRAIAGNPVTYTLRASLTEAGVAAPFEGILEVSNVDE